MLMDLGAQIQLDWSDYFDGTWYDGTVHYDYIFPLCERHINIYCKKKVYH